MIRTRLKRTPMKRSISPARRRQIADDGVARANCIMRALGCCERCGTFGGNDLQAHHIVTRRRKDLRHDPLNMLALCFLCHLWWHANPKAARAWFRSKFGSGRADYLGLKETPHEAS